MTDTTDNSSDDHDDGRDGLNRAIGNSPSLAQICSEVTRMAERLCARAGLDVRFMTIAIGHPPGSGMVVAGHLNACCAEHATAALLQGITELNGLAGPLRGVRVTAHSVADDQPESDAIAQAAAEHSETRH